MIESNIGITSNIYVRSNPEIRKDENYTQKITGVRLLRAIREQYIGVEKIKLTPIQEEILSGSQTCYLAKSGEKSHGPVMSEGSLQWVNRCEYSDCPEFEKCDTQKIVRETVIDDGADEKKSLQKFSKSLGVIIQDNTVVFERDRNTAKTEEVSREYSAPAEQDTGKILEISRQYRQITSPDCIVSAPLDSHIILNSGPGTGKTYTIIQRLVYILANGLCPADEVYILCYTRSAKKVIEDKINQAVIEGKIEPSAKNICVLTFDSYATYFLTAMKEQGVISENFENYDYNRRIKLFNKYISEEDFEGVSYFVVDEIQDLVNERAEMVLKILEYLNCGYLLAGDRCQSIYDYEADKDARLDSVKFYELAEKQFPDDMLRYEITVNRRQSPKLAEEAEKMRSVLLSEDFVKQNSYAKNVMSKFSGRTKIEQYIKSLSRTPDVPTAILCRNNGEAEYISGLLCEKGISHNLNRGVNNPVPLPRWIADVFWDYCPDTMGKDVFVERFSFRTGLKYNSGEIWDILCKMTNSQDRAFINIPELVKKLTVVNNIPNEFYGETPLLTVSTIHKAKGSEFDSVILVESDIKPAHDSAEEARVRYVAITRPREEFVTMKKNSKYFKRILSGRVIETGLHNMYKTSKKYCKCMTVGLTGDVDSNSFVSGEFGDVLDLQEYIARNVRIYDRLTARRSAATGLYEIYHKNRCIGSLSEKITDELGFSVSATDYKYNLPDRLENLYVSGITTEILKKFSKNTPVEYQKSGICFGVQVTGLARLVFEKR